MDPALGAMFDRLRSGDCLDLDSRKGKAPGGYQYNRDYTRQPFIFMNAAGLHKDLVTMLHEAGHAFHSMLCDHDPLLHYRHVPTEFAEVASISMELLTYPYLDEFYTEADARRARRNHLEKLVTILPWIATIDAFQHWIYTNPGHSRADRRAFWEQLMERFGSRVDWTGLEDFRAASWQAQLHLFEVPFYYIEYAIAQLGAQQLWLQAKRNEKSAVQHYQRALRLGGSKPLPELFDAAELKFDFTTPTVRELMADVRREIEKLPA
jgi:oligoendopeptidase F